MIESIQRSLLADLITNHHVRSVMSRASLDRLYKSFMGMTVTGRVACYKALNAVLINSDTPVWHTPDGDAVHLTGHPYAVKAIRQALGFFSRLSANVDEQTKQMQLKEAKERVSRAPTYKLTSDDEESMRRFIAFVIGPLPPPDDWPMKHGPGAVAEGNKAAKGEFKKLPRKLIQYADTHYSISTAKRQGPDGVSSWVFNPMDSMRWFQMPHAPRYCPEWEQPVTRVVTVPKDATKVRIISCEPAASQFVQQGLMGIMYDRLALFPMINPLDQQRNRQLALRGSVDHSIATLDSSNASDEVRWLHVRKLFPYEWVEAFTFLRSEAMKFPDDEVVQITTFAPMGSALCFPVELIMFAAVAYAARCRYGTVTPVAFLREDLYGFFGDDAIVPDWLVDDYFDIADKLGIPLNKSKCCIHGAHFRESCGLDCFEGVDVSIIRPREISVRRIAAAPMVLHANRLFAAGFVKTAQHIADTVRAPVSLGYGPDLAIPDLRWPRYGKIRYNRALMRCEGQVPRNRYPDAPPLQGWVGLHTWFTCQRQSTSPFRNEDRCIPTIAWACLDADMALEQCLRSHRGMTLSKGKEPYAKGTPVGSSEAEVAVQTRPEDMLPSISPTLLKWYEALERAGFQIVRVEGDSIEFR